MCLYKPIDKEPCKKGYKVFYRKEEEISMYEKDVIFPTDTWIDEVGYRPSWFHGESLYYTTSYEAYTDSATYITYPVGWHVFHTLDAAMEWITNDQQIIREVEVKEPVAVGEQIYAGRCWDVTVCKKIKILKEQTCEKKH